MHLQFKIHSLVVESMFRAEVDFCLFGATGGGTKTSMRCVRVCVCMCGGGGGDKIKDMFINFNPLIFR